MPLLNVAAKFPAPSRLGDMLDFSLAVSRLGTKSFTLKIEAHCGEELRLISDQSSAWTRRDGGVLRAEAIPPDMPAAKLRPMPPRTTTQPPVMYSQP